MQSPGPPDRVSVIWLVHDTPILANFINLAMADPQVMKHFNRLAPQCILMIDNVKEMQEISSIC